MARTPATIGEIRDNLSMIRGNLKDASRLLEGNVFDETIALVRKRLRPIAELIDLNK
jgi:hypothetical protein